MNQFHYKKYSVIESLRNFAGTLSLTVLLLCGFAMTANATLTGKIAGEIVDFVSGEPIVGATVTVVGAPNVAVSDEDGEYYILEIPAGTVTLQFSAPGYITQTREGARVLLDLTTAVKVRLVRSDVEVLEPIKVVAEEPPIQKDLTATRYTVTAEQMAYLPNSVALGDVLLNVSGAVSDRDGSLHIRGGRSGAITYIYDGVQVTDPFTRTLGLRIVPHFLEEVDLTSGGFPAEYGEAGSGIVNAVTREGKSEYSGSIRLYDGSTHKYDRFSGKIGDLARSSNQALSANFSGPLHILGLKNATFFIAGEGLRDAGFLPHNFIKSRTLAGKVAARPSTKLKLTAAATYFTSDGEDYDHIDINGISYDLNLDGLGIIKRKALTATLRAKYMHNPETIFNASVSRFETKSKLAPTHLFDVYWDQWPGFVADSTGAYDQANGALHQDNYNYAPEYGFTGYTFGDDFLPRYSFRSTKYTAAAGSIVKQIDKRNQIKIGGEFRRYNVLWDEKQFFNSVPFGEKYNFFPAYSFAYVQHKLEYYEIIVNAGLRFDYLSNRVNYFEDPQDQTNPTVLQSTPKSQLSPRLGVSHPVAENTILRFNYGLFFQPPTFKTMFTNLQGEINSGFPLLGNPDLLPEKTVAYELGLDHSLPNNFVLGLTAYYKGIENLIATRRIFTDGGSQTAAQVVTGFVNEDYSTVKGLDLSITKRRKRYFSGRLSYSLMVAQGNSPDSRFAYVDFITQQDTTLPVVPYNLDFDQRHTLVVNADLRTPFDWEGKFLGLMPLSGAWGISGVARYGSGLPYTKQNIQTGERIGGLNEFRMPFTFSIDARINRDFRFSNGKYVLSAFIEIENIMNRRNVVNVYSNGLPDTDGTEYLDAGTLITQREGSFLHDLILNDPQNYSPPRTIRMGLQFNF